MKLQLASVYMLPLEADFMGLVVRRMWTKPWRYKIEAICWGPVETPNVLIASDLTKAGVIVIFKLFDVPKVRSES